MINNEKKVKSGFVTIVGKPNSGKSTLLNCIIGHKVSIATHKKNTTRNQIRGIYNDYESQIIFIDTPGFLNSKNKLEEDMQQRIINSLKGVDVILYLLPYWKKLDVDYLQKIELTKKINSKKYLLLTKVDKALKKEELYPYASKYNDNNFFDKIIPISSYRGTNIDTLKEELKKDLSLDILFYEENKFYELDDKFYIAEIIREKALFNLNEEVPHHLFVVVTDLDFKKRNSIFIRAEIIVDRLNLKQIIIGKDGEKLKIIGQKSREELEFYFNKKIYLETFVKVRKNWKNKDSIIKAI